jgi:hypothetical protein
MSAANTYTDLTSLSDGTLNTLKASAEVLLKASDEESVTKAGQRYFDFLTDHLQSDASQPIRGDHLMKYFSKYVPKMKLVYLKGAKDKKLRTLPVGHTAEDNAFRELFARFDVEDGYRQELEKFSDMVYRALNPSLKVDDDIEVGCVNIASGIVKISGKEVKLRPQCKRILLCLLIAKKDSLSGKSIAVLVDDIRNVAILDPDKHNIKDKKGVNKSLKYTRNYICELKRIVNRAARAQIIKKAEDGGYFLDP